jgi:hypothetical protein
VVIRPATEADIPAVLPVFEAAKAIMRADGNHDQWGRPRISRGTPFFFATSQEGAVCHFERSRRRSREIYRRVLRALTFPRTTYSHIDGAWLTDEPYGVIHRIASYPEVHGIFSAIIDFAAARYPHLRIDTHRDNRIMQHLIDAACFTYCGSSGWKTAPSVSPTSGEPLSFRAKSRNL